MQSPSQPPEDAAPVDACPYRRPFPPAFRGCVAYSPKPVRVASDPSRPPQTIWTCAHLTSGPEEHLESRGYYPRCALGDQARREEWARARQRIQRPQPPDHPESAPERWQGGGQQLLSELHLNVDLATVLRIGTQAALGRAARMQAEARARLTRVSTPGPGSGFQPQPFGKNPSSPG